MDNYDKAFIIFNRERGEDDNSVEPITLDQAEDLADIYDNLD